MDNAHESFIIKNHRKLSSRQIAKTLGLSRAEVEKFIQDLKIKPETFRPISARTEILTVISVFVAALFIRLVYVHWLKATPFFGPLTGALKDKLDDGLYNQLASEISRGNWAGKFSLGAYRLPLYPYFLAVLYRLFGNHLLAVHYIQSLIGSLSTVLVYFVSKEALKNTRAAVISAVLFGLYVPFIFFENLLLGESLSIFFNLIGLFFLLKAFSRARVPALAAAGIAWGISILLRPNTMIAVLFAAGYVFYFFGLKAREIKKGLLFSGILLAAVFFTILPMTIRNYIVYDDLLPVSAIGGINLYIGNGPEANGKFHSLKEVGSSLDKMIVNSEKIAEQEAGKPLKPSEVSRYWSNKTLNYILSSPGRFTALFFKKLFFFFNAYEFSDILDIQFVAQFIPILGISRFAYGLIAIFALIGAVILHPKRTAGLNAAGLFALGYTLSVLMFFVTSRYRLPAVPFFIIYAGGALDTVMRCFTLRDQKKLTKVILIFLPVAAFVFWPVETNDFATDYNSLAISMRYAGRFAEAETYYRKAIEISPNYPSPYFNLAVLLDDLGYHNGAIPLREKHERLKQAKPGQYEKEEAGSVLTPEPILAGVPNGVPIDPSAPSAAGSGKPADRKELLEDVTDLLDNFIQEDAFDELGVGSKKAPNNTVIYLYRGKPLNECDDQALAELKKQAIDILNRQRAGAEETRRAIEQARARH